MRVPFSRRSWFLIVVSSFLIFCSSCSSASGTSPASLSTPSVTTPLIVYKGDTGALTIQPIYALSRSPDGTRIVSGGDDQTAQVWNATTGKTLLTYSGHGDSVWGLSWSPDGTRIVSSSGNLADPGK